MKFKTDKDLIRKQIWKSKNKHFKILNRIKKKERINDPVFYWCKQSTTSHKKYDLRIDEYDLFNYAKDKGNCEYCDVGLEWSYKDKIGKPKSNSPSLDRMNNEEIITLDNIRICCHKCNTTKSNRTLQEFVDYCKKVIATVEINETERSWEYSFLIN